MFTSGVIKSNAPVTAATEPNANGNLGNSTFGKLRLTPLSKLLKTPVPSAASFNDSAALATLDNAPANSSIDLTAMLFGPFPIVHWFVFCPSVDDAVGRSQPPRASDIPNNPSAFSLNIPPISVGNISPKSPSIGPIASSMLPIILFIIPALNWSPIQSLKFSTLSNNGANKSDMLLSNLSVTFFIIQGIAFSIFKIEGAFAFCAKLATFFASAMSPVSARTAPYLSL